MNDPFSKELESMKRFQTEMQEIKNSIQIMGSRSEQCENSVRTTRRGCCKEIDYSEMPWKQQKNMKNGYNAFWRCEETNKRVIGISKKSKGSTKGMKNLFTEILTENFANIGNELQIQICEACRTPNSHSQKEPHQDTKQNPSGLAQD